MVAISFHTDHDAQIWLPLLAAGLHPCVNHRDISCVLGNSRGTYPAVPQEAEEGSGQSGEEGLEMPVSAAALRVAGFAVLRIFDRPKIQFRLSLFLLYKWERVA